MKTEILHRSDCSLHNEPYIPNEPCDCAPIYTIKSIVSMSYEAAKETPCEHEGQSQERADYFQDGAMYVMENALKILKVKNNPEYSLSAKEYWYQCGIADAMALLKEFGTGKL